MFCKGQWRQFMHNTGSLFLFCVHSDIDLSWHDFCDNCDLGQFAGKYNFNRLLIESDRRTCLVMSRGAISGFYGNMSILLMLLIDRLPQVSFCKLISIFLRFKKRQKVISAVDAIKWGHRSSVVYNWTCRVVVLQLAKIALQKISPPPQ